MNFKMGLTVYVRVFTPLFFAQAALSVIVTLDGQTGTVVKKVKAGDATAVLQCDLSSSAIGGTPVLEWTKSVDPNEEGSHIYYQSAIVTTNWPSNKFYYQSPFSLGIRNINSGDNGYYKCRGVLPGDMPSAATAIYHLVVLVPPSPQISCGFPLNLAITQGQSAQFQCAEVNVQANPPPLFKWYKNGVELPTISSGDSTYSNSSFSYDTNTGLLTFQTVVSSDAGEYYCTVTNEAGSSSCSAADITPTMAIDQVICEFPIKLPLTVGGSAVFRCDEAVKQANPAPVFVWYKDDKMLPTTSVGDSSYPDSNFTYSTATGVLNFKNVVGGDAGQYYCIASNNISSSKCEGSMITTGGDGGGPTPLYGLLFGVAALLAVVFEA